MKKTGFSPKEILFSLTAKCNINCSHCDIEKSSRVLNKKAALKFVAASSGAGIGRVGFTGGEPFLALELMCAIAKEAAHRGMLFSRIMTNGVWFRTSNELVQALRQLFLSGYDGDICLSVDAFHGQNIGKLKSFIKAAASVWARPDIVSIASVKGVRDAQTRTMLSKLARLLHARLIVVNGRAAAIKSKDIFIKIFDIDLSPVGKAAVLKNAWDGRWFKDDLCRGPGNVFFVLPDGTVKPCCGYAADAGILTIGSIGKDSPKKILENARKNPFVAAVFNTGFHPIRKRLEKTGIRFPGKTTNHCFFCGYLTSSIPSALLI